MPRVSTCFKAAKLAQAEAHLLDEAIAEYQGEGKNAREAARAAVQDYLKDLEGEHADILRQVEEQRAKETLEPARPAPDLAERVRRKFVAGEPLTAEERAWAAEQGKSRLSRRSRPQNPASRGVSFADDLERQAAFLNQRAHDAGYADIGDMLSRDYPAFEHLAEQWRAEHPGRDLDTVLSRATVKRWPEGFPKLFAHTSVAKVVGHPDFASAKAGDTIAAQRLVQGVVKTERIRELAQRFPDAVLVPVREVEATGHNRIPLALAAAIADVGGLRVDNNIVSRSRVARKGKSAVGRLLARKVFDGPVRKGGQYLLVDDVVTQGGTLNELRTHIENNGGHVVGVTALAGAKGSYDLAIKPETVDALNGKFGEQPLRQFLYDHRIAGAVEALTESEGRAILKFGSLDTLRDRIAQEGLSGVHEGLASRARASHPLGIEVPESGPTEPAFGGLSVSDVHSFIGASENRWMRGLVTPVSRVDDLPEGALAEVRARGAESDVEAVFWQGHVYAVTPHIADLARLRSVLDAHELSTHLGLRVLLGDKLDPVLKSMAFNVDVRARADAWARENLGQGLAELSGKARLEAIEEGVARYAEAHGIPATPFWQRVLARLRAALRAAGIVRTFSDADLQALLARSARAAREAGAALIRTPAPVAQPEEVVRASRAPLPTGNADLDSAIAKIGRKPEFADRWQEVRENPRPFLRGALERINQGLFDSLYGFERAEKKVNPHLTPEQSGAIAAHMATSSGDTVMFVMQHGAVEWRDGMLKGIPGSKGLLAILKAVEPTREDPHRLENFFRYLIGTRAERLMGEGREHLFTLQEVQALKSLGDAHPEFATVAREYAALSRQVLDVAQGAGLIDPAQRALWEHADYIPFYRLTEESRTRGPGKKSGLAGQSSGVKMLKGGTAALGDPLENILQNWTHLIDASMKNHALGLGVDNLAGSEFMEKEPYRWKPVLVPEGELRKFVEEHYGPLLQAAGVDASLLDLAQLRALNDMLSMKAPEGKDIIRVMRGGHPEYYRVHDDLLLRSVTALASPQLGGLIMKFMGAPKRWLTKAVTAGPEFMLANLMRDALHASIITPGMRPWAAIAGIARTAANSPETLALMAAGASFRGGFNATDPKQLAEHVRAALRDEKFAGTVLDTPQKLANFVKRAWDHWEEFGSRFENASRVALYRQLRAEGKSDLEAAYKAKDLMDFSRRGDWAWVQLLTQLVPFMGARLQGLQKLGRGALENPKSFALKGLTLALGSVALYLMNRDDERFKALEDWERDTYYHIFLGEEHFRLPKPFEVGMLFGSLPERIAQAFDEGKPGLPFQRATWMLGQMLDFNPIPQVAAPVIQQWANRDMFTGRPLVPSRLQHLAPEAQYSPYTSATMIELGQLLGLSPARLEAFYKGYLGTLGMYALAAADIVTRQLAGYPEQPSWRPEDYPVLGRFSRGNGPARNTKFLTDFYDAMEKVDGLYAAVQEYRRTGNAVDAEKLLTGQRDLLRLHRPLDALARRLSALNRQIRNVQMDPKFSPAAKREAIDRLLTRRNALAERGAKLAESAR